MKKKFKPGDYSDVDIESFLDHHGIDFRTSGENIGQDWIGICCPWCTDSLYHCGINLSTKVVTCWICGESGTCLKLVSTLLNCNWREAREALKPFGGHFREIKEQILADKVIFPTRVGGLTANGIKYLTDREFDPNEIIEKYGVGETGILSKLEVGTKTWDFRNRIIIPIIMDHQIISYTGRDWTDQSSTRYKNAPSEAGVLPMTNCLYNIDRARQKVLLVEGPSDVWRMGDNSVATMGVKTTSEQIQRIISKKFKKAVILFDDGAAKPALKLANTLNPFIDSVSVFTLTDNDPGGLSVTEASKLKFQLMEGE